MNTSLRVCIFFLHSSIARYISRDMVIGQTYAVSVGTHRHDRRQSFSDEQIINVRLTPNRTPNAPRLRIAAVGDGCVISWDEPDDNETPITGYRIERDKDVDFDYKPIAVVGSDVTEYHDDGDLLPGVFYFYRVSAINSVGDSQWGESPVCALTPKSPVITSPSTGVILHDPTPVIVGSSESSRYHIQIEIINTLTRSRILHTANPTLKQWTTELPPLIPGSYIINAIARFVEPSSLTEFTSLRSNTVFFTIELDTISNEGVVTSPRTKSSVYDTHQKSTITSTTNKSYISDTTSNEGVIYD